MGQCYPLKGLGSEAVVLEEAAVGELLGEHHEALQEGAALGDEPALESPAAVAVVVGEPAEVQR